MKRRKTGFITSLFCLAAAAGIFLLKCSPASSDLAGNSSQSGNGKVVGMLYEPDGSTPAAHATVSVRKKNSLADTSTVLGAGTSTVSTDDSGKFAIDSLDTGTYTIEGTDGNNNFAIIESVPINNPDSTVTLPPDTLKPAGAIKGIIRLSEGGDLRAVFVFAFGIDRFARVNADGSFKVSSLAHGTYDLRMVSFLNDYGVLDTVNIPVISTDTTDLDTIDLPFTGIPTPKNVSISYDTLKQIVTLTWNKLDTSLAKSVNVYRRNVDSNTVSVRINSSPIVDTIYRDSSGIQDQTYEYRVAAADKNATEGTKSAGVSVKVVGAFVLIDSIGSAGTQNGQFSAVSGITVLSNGDIVVLDYNQHWAQIFDSTGTFINRFGQQGNSDGQFQNPIAITKDDSDYVYISDEIGGRVQKFDKNGNFIKMWTVGQYCRGVTYTKNKLYVTSKYPSGFITINVVSDSIKFISIPNIEPYGIDFDGFSQTLFLVDNLNNRVMHIDTLGNILNSWGSLGTKLGEFDNPTYISFFSNNAVYITDSNNKRVQMFTSNGEIVTSFGSGKFNYPQGITTGGSNNIYIADQFNFHIYKYTFNF